MTQDEIIRMAQKAGILEPIDLLPSNQWRQDTIRELERFAALVAEATKEKAAKVCEGFTANVRHQSTEAHNFALECSKAIREMK